MTEPTLSYICGMVIKILALLTPSAILSAFITFTRGETGYKRMAVALQTGAAIYIIGQLLLIFGPAIFSIFGFTLDAFRIGVGILLFLEAIDIMNDDVNTPRPRANANISVVPLAIPLGMGPATIGAIMVMGAQADGMGDILTISLCIFMAALIVALTLCLAEQIQRIMGKTGILVMAKLTGLLIAAMAAQVIFTGIRAFLR